MDRRPPRPRIGGALHSSTRPASGDRRMARILRDADLTELVDRRSAVDLMDAGFRADAAGEVVTVPRVRSTAAGVSVAWLGAALPQRDLLGFRTYLFGASGVDRGDQIVSLYRHSTTELRALFLGRMLGAVRTGAAAVAAVRAAEPGLRALGVVGTGTQAREVVASAVAALPLDSIVVYSPRAAHRAAFRAWAASELDRDVTLAEDVRNVVAAAPAVVLATSAETTIVTPEMLAEPRLVVSISAYRRPEVDGRLLDVASTVWTDSVTQASAPGTLFETDARRSKLAPLLDERRLEALRDRRSSRFVFNTGAAWEETILAESLCRAAEARNVGIGLELPG